MKTVDLERLAARLLLVAAAICLAASPLSAGEPPVGIEPTLPFDFDAMFQQFFGKDTPQDEEALAAIQVAARDERRMGEAMVRVYLDHLKRQKIRVLSRGRDVQYLRDLVNTIRPLMNDPDRYPAIKVYVALSSKCDARSFPGGTLVFFRGLLESADSEAALVGIVGHELSHLDRGHHLRRIRRAKLAQQTFAGEGKPASWEEFFSAGTTLMRLWARPFRPEDEAAADRDGARWAYLAGYDSREMGKLFLRLYERHRARQIPIPAFFRTHPPAPDRCRAITEVYDQLQQERPNDRPYIGRENLRRRTARARGPFER